ncbi:MAG: helix-turn-helix domain-containing protein [Marinilabiliaceae bacterium]|nr:helix-turn-helix domain-containing protein [Marinilabiliaceae bacterium]
MTKLKYTVIKDVVQYQRYCEELELLLGQCSGEEVPLQDEIDLLTVLIDKWDREHHPFHDADPVEMLKYLMIENGLKANDISQILHLSKGTVSKMLNYQKGFSKATIRKLADYFKVSQDAFNRSYPLVMDERDGASRSQQRSLIGA